MESIPTVFVRNDIGRVVFPATVEPECQWVVDGEGIATIKWDGSACAVIGGVLYKRHRHQAEKGAPPKGWVHHTGTDQESGHGWLPVREDPSDRWHREAWGHGGGLADGTYELVGPKVQSNPYRLDRHELWKHGDRVCMTAPRDAEGLMKYLGEMEHEGIVFHHPDGRMAKIKCRDFGLSWKK